MAPFTRYVGETDLGTQVSRTFRDKQETFYRSDARNLSRIASPGNQYIIQLIKGGYLEYFSSFAGKKMLDMGCGSGFNLVSFAMMGWQSYGCEISKDIVEYAKDNVKRFGFDVEIVVGENKNIPFGSQCFDLLLSTNVIHYVDSEEGMRNNIQEYARILKKQGRILLLTTHPENWILEGSERLNGNLHQITKGDDFRDGEIFFVFQDEQEIGDYFSGSFKEIKIGINRLDFFTKRVLNYVVTGVKS